RKRRPLDAWDKSECLEKVSAATARRRTPPLARVSPEPRSIAAHIEHRRESPRRAPPARLAEPESHRSVARACPPIGGRRQSSGTLCEVRLFPATRVRSPIARARFVTPSDTHLTSAQPQGLPFSRTSTGKTSSITSGIELSCGYKSH